MFPGSIRLALALALLLSACKVTVPPLDDPDTRFACRGDEDCADDYYCFHEGGADLGYCTSGSTTDDPCLNQFCSDGLVCAVNQSGQASCEECRYVPGGCETGWICAKSNSSVSSRCAPSCEMDGSTCDGIGAPGQCIVSQGFPNGNDNQLTVQVCASCGTMCPASECTYASTTVEAWEQGAVCDSPPITCNPHATCSNMPTQSCSTGCYGSDICGEDGYCHPSTCVASSDCPSPFVCNMSHCELATACPAVPCAGDDMCVAGACQPPPWYQLGDSVVNGLPGSSGAYDFDMTLDASGAPVLAWISTGALSVRRWDPPSEMWSDLGQIVPSDASAPSIAVNSNGDVIVAWQHQVSADNGIYVMRYVSGSWQSYTQATYPMNSNTGVGLAISLMAPTLAYAPQVAIDSLDRVVVAWRERNSTGFYQVYLRKWVGGYWNELGGSASNSGISNSTADVGYESPSLAIAGEEVLVGWTVSNDVLMARYDGASWPQVGPGSSPNLPTSLSVAFDKNNNPTVAYEYYHTGSSANVVEVWRDNAGVPQYIGYESYAQQPSLARDNASNLALAFGTTSGTNHAYLGYFRDDATGWADVDGSRTYDGVSFPVPPAYSASAQNPIVAAGSRLCVAWQENGMIRLRCHDQPPP